MKLNNTQIFIIFFLKSRTDKASLFDIVKFYYISELKNKKNIKLDDNLYFEFKQNIKILIDKKIIKYKDEGNETFYKYNLWKEIIKNIEVQSWCNNNCSYCYSTLRENLSISKSDESIISEINDFVHKWWKIVLLSWVNLWAYSCENTLDYESSKLYKLVDKILKETEIDIIQLWSIWVEFFSKELLNIFLNERVLSSIHISLQSWSDKILSKMNRNYNKAKIIKVLNEIKKLNRIDSVKINISADIMVWFPWEDNKNFLETLDIIKDYWINNINCFKFSNYTFWERVPASFYEDNNISSEDKDYRYNEVEKYSLENENIFFTSQKWLLLKAIIYDVYSDWDFRWITINNIKINKNNFLLKTKENIKKWDIIFWEFIDE